MVGCCYWVQLLRSQAQSARGRSDTQEPLQTARLLHDSERMGGRNEGDRLRERQQ